MTSESAVILQALRGSTEAIQTILGGRPIVLLKALIPFTAQTIRARMLQAVEDNETAIDSLTGKSEIIPIDDSLPTAPEGDT